ncbi:MAG: DUF4339 domain-containing protein [Planctomycetales bacterium]|nr:DUF4339 domain-containing protein [Planctomycetales bacterium]
MGIRFLCPNGHKLNVKAFLAGKRGICPDCDARFIVPTVSGGKAVSVEPTPDTQIPDPELPSTSIATSSGAPLPPASDQNLPEAWYVRLAAGEQYGPANTELMSDWVNEGRVASDSMVWRTGWEHWKPASEVLPAFQVPPPVEPVAPDPPLGEASGDSSSSPALSLATRPRRPRLNSRQERARQMTVMLGTLVLVLAVILVLVLWFQN